MEFMVVRPGLALCVAILGGLSACALPMTQQVSVSHPEFAPRSRDVAELPALGTGGNAYQDHAGPAFVVGSGPEIADTGGNSYPDFPAGEEAPIREGNFAVIMPNGGNRPVESLNSLPSPP